MPEVHHVVLERWSQRDSPLHRRDARAKILAALVLLILIGTCPRATAGLAAGFLAMLSGAAMLARLPLTGILARAGVVLPFSLAFAAISVLAGDTGRAQALLLKSYLSALVVLLLAGTTPMPLLLNSMERMGAPAFLLTVAQFLYRYLFVISEEAQHMRTAAVSRGATLGSLMARGARFRAAAGAVAVLFARSYARAERIHRSMLARAFDGHFRRLDNSRFQLADAAFLAMSCVAGIAARLAAQA